MTHSHLLALSLALGPDQWQRFLEIARQVSLAHALKRVLSRQSI